MEKTNQSALFQRSIAYDIGFLILEIWSHLFELAAGVAKE